jgi:hypothetical protein
MSVTKTTLISHIYNEEYLLPFWLRHHKNMFDEIIIIDYNSTDKSIEICKSVCPECKIIKTRNEYFGAKEVDAEVMDIESSIEGIKIALNVTEFLLCETTIKDIFVNDTAPISYAINVLTPFSKNTYNITNYYELFSNLLNDDVVFVSERGTRQLHNFPNGNYDIGRHSTYNTSIPTNKAHIIWFGFYPMNDQLLKRKLQIQTNMSQSDKDHGFGFQHLYNKETILTMNQTKSASGMSLKEINFSLYNLLRLHIENTATS